MTPTDMALNNIIWAMIYIVLYFYLKKPVVTFFEVGHPIRLLYHFILPMLLGLNMGNAFANYALLK